MLLDTNEFIEKSKELDIPYKKYIDLNAFQLENLLKSDNFIKKEDRPIELKISEIENNNSNPLPIVDTHYYFRENEYVIILKLTMSNYEAVPGYNYELDPDSEDYIDEFIIEKFKK